MTRLLLAIILLMTVGPVSADGKVDALFQTHCASCHGSGRLGGMGPALLPENLKRLRKPKAVDVIKNGRAATQMPAFASLLTVEEINSLTDYIYKPLQEVPHWGLAEMRASRVQHVDESQLSPSPIFQADMLNLFVVVELADHHATLLDGDTFEPIHRFQTRFALHGGPKYSPDGRLVYFASRDGWISKFDIYNLKVVAEIRAGINTRNVALSGDGRYLMVANYLPHSLVLIDARTMNPIKIIETRSADQSSRVSAVYDATPRNSFIAALKDIPQVWEINYEDDPPVGFSGWVHDYRKDSGEADSEQKFPVRRIPVAHLLDDFFFDQAYEYLIGTSREGRSQVLDLDAGRVTASLDLAGMPHLGSGITWPYAGTTVLATPNLRDSSVTVIDVANWKTIKVLQTLGPGFFMRSHENSPYAWTDVFFGPHRDAVHVIDKSSLEIVKTLRPAPGKTAAHVEFTRDGKYALLSIWDEDGALVIYDGDTLEEVKRIPMKKPSGKYNVFNKITKSAGTSH